MRKNLISKGVLDSGECKIVTWEGGKKVIHGYLVVMKGICQGNLYVLFSTMLTDGATVGTNGSGGDPCELTRLCIDRLGICMKKGLDLLGK